METELKKALSDLQVAFSLASREGGQGRVIASKIQSADAHIRNAMKK